MSEAVSLRYVVLRHDGIDEPHYDLLFETAPGSDLAAFRSNEWPVTKLAEFTALRNHRRFYLTYEGPISGDRGNVQRVHDGTHKIEINDARTFMVTLETGQTIRFAR
jgi:hypothetical protein